MSERKPWEDAGVTPIEYIERLRSTARERDATIASLRDEVNFQNRTIATVRKRLERMEATELVLSENAPKLRGGLSGLRGSLAQLQEAIGAVDDAFVLARECAPRFLKSVEEET